MQSNGSFWQYGRWCLSILMLSGVLSTSAAPTTEEYEYVIVGSGPGGGPLGANLARQGHSVLVLEAGEDHGNSLLQVLPSMSGAVSEDPTMSWEFFVNLHSDPKVAQQNSKYTWELKNGSFYVGTDPPEDASPLGILYPRTGTLGGCATHNAMNFALPPDNDWESYAELTGDDSWKASNMRKYYERLEDCHYLPEGTPGHGFSGWLGSNQNDLSIYDTDDGFFDVVRASMRATGDASNPTKQDAMKLMKRDMNRQDPKRYEHEGVFQIPLHVNEKRQRTNSRTYLIETLKEKNADGSQKYPLTIKTSSLATKVLFEDGGAASDSELKASGVEYLQGQALYKADRRFDGTQRGIPMVARATREVIIAAGVFNTPQLLKLSGVGPRDELNEFDIPVKLELPAVGTNMQDNYETGVEALASSDFLNIFENCTFLAPGDPCLEDFKENASGAYSQGASPVGMLVRSSESENEDTDLFFFGGGASIFRGFFPGYSRLTAPANLFWWSIVKMQVKNRAGTIKLRSNNPQDPPEINFNYFKEGRESELNALEEGVDFARKIFNMTETPFSPFKNTVPGPNVRNDIVTETWGHHATCSCPMGTDAKTSCVDSRFKVHGVSNLRVVDGSIFPRTPGAFPVLPTFMISEKATDVILEDDRQ